MINKTDPGKPKSDYTLDDIIYIQLLSKQKRAKYSLQVTSEHWVALVVALIIVALPVFFIPALYNDLTYTITYIFACVLLVVDRLIKKIYGKLMGN